MIKLPLVLLFCGGGETVTPLLFASRVSFFNRLIICIVLFSTSVFPFSSALQVVGSKLKAYSIHLHLIFLFPPTDSFILLTLGWRRNIRVEMEDAEEYKLEWTLGKYF